MKIRMMGTPRTRFLVPALVASLTVSGCTWFQSDINRGYSEKGHWEDSEPRVYTTADVRMVIRRRHPQTGQPVTCTEPTPDVAKALSTASAITAKGGSNAGASGEIGLSGGSAEAVAELAGRSTALIALRDGLFRTCEAYVNGAIGSDAYALVLSRYGQLMTTLFLAEDIRGAAALSNTTAPTSPTLITVSPSAGSTTQIAGSGSQTGTGSPAAGGNTTGNGNGKKTKTSGTVATVPGFLKVANVGDGAAPSAAQSPDPAPAKDTSGKDAAAKGGSPAKDAPAKDPGASPPANQQSANTPPKASDQNNTQPANSPGSSNPSPSAIAAVSLVRMNEDYFDLDVNFMHQLVVACINEYDPTRVRLRVVDLAGSPADELQRQLADARARAQKLEENQQQLILEQQLVQQIGQLQSNEQQLVQQLTQLQSKVKPKSSPPANGGVPVSGAPPDTSSPTLGALSDMPVLLHTVVQGENPFLRELCSSLARVQTLVSAENTLLPMFSGIGHPAANVKPDAGLVPVPAASDDSKNPAPTVKKKANNSRPAASQSQQQGQSQSQSQRQGQPQSESQQPPPAGPVPAPGPARNHSSMTPQPPAENPPPDPSGKI